jgi:bifunctional non-homologous end joining protein LigD
MLKGVASRYIPGSRSSGWFKVKINSTTDVVITGYEPGKDSNAGLVGSFEVSIMTSQGFRMVGHCGNFTDEFRAKISKPDGSLKDEYYMKVIEVSAQGVGARGHLRHCLFRRFRPDKAAHDCGPDQLAHLPAA